MNCPSQPPQFQSASVIWIIRQVGPFSAATIGINRITSPSRGLVPGREELTWKMDFDRQFNTGPLFPRCTVYVRVCVCLCLCLCVVVRVRVFVSVCGGAWSYLWLHRRPKEASIPEDWKQNEVEKVWRRPISNNLFLKGWNNRIK